jgi:hypothetical protein
MKIRHGFVSNSSSSSFVIPKSALSELQMYKIRNYQEIVKDVLAAEAKAKAAGVEVEYPNRFEYCDDAWHISETEHIIKGSTTMDNFDFSRFLAEIVGVAEEDIEWGEGWDAWHYEDGEGVPHED